jgi:hypothetical protein
MQAADFARVLAIEGDLVVGLVPRRQGGEFGAREGGQRGEVQAVDGQGKQVDGGEGQRHGDRGREAHEFTMVLRVHGTQLGESQVPETGAGRWS